MQTRDSHGSCSQRIIVAWPKKVLLSLFNVIAARFRKPQKEQENVRAENARDELVQLDRLKQNHKSPSSPAQVSPLHKAPTSPTGDSHVPASASSRDTDAIFLQIADLMDEMVPLQEKATGVEKMNMEFIAERLETILEDHGLTRARDVAWNSSRMRAVKAVAPKNGEADYTVMETLESGLFSGQRILRKQSVVITKRSQST